jgi:hypothetical protein
MGLVNPAQPLPIQPCSTSALPTESQDDWI